MKIPNCKCGHELSMHYDDGAMCLDGNCDCEGYEAEEDLERALRVIPLAQRALDVLMSESDVAVRRAAFKTMKVAVDYWPESD